MNFSLVTIIVTMIATIGGLRLTQSTFVYTPNYEYLSTVKLNEYNGYFGNVKLLRFSMPSDVIIALWRLQLIATDSCPSTNFYFYLDHAGFPVISPNNRTFPKNFALGRLTKLYINQTISGQPAQNKPDIFFNVTSPTSGYWFSAAFVDSNDQAVKPDFLRLNCSFYLTASLSIFQINDTVVIYPNSPVSSTNHQIFKFYKLQTTSDHIGPLIYSLNINNNDNNDKNNNKKENNNNNSNDTTTTSSSSCTLTALLKASTFPDMTNFSLNEDNVICNSSSNNCSVSSKYPLANTVYYLAVSSTCNYTFEATMVENCSFSSTVETIAATLITQKLFAGNLLNPLMISNLLNMNESSSSSKLLLLNGTTSSSLTSLLSRRLISSRNLAKQQIISDLVCEQIPHPTDTFRFIGPSYFAVKYYFNSNYNRSNALLIQNDRKPYFFEFLVDLANHGGTLNFVLVNNLVLDPSYNSHSSSSTNQQPSSSATATTSSQKNNSNASASLTSAEMNNTSNNSNNRVLSSFNFLNASPFEDELMNINMKKENDFNLANVKVFVRVCLLYESMSSYLNCPETYGLMTQSHTNLYTNLQLSVPYPMMGRWYLAVWKECYDAISNQSVPCPAAYVPYAVIQISSDQCSNDYCSEFGNCFIINSQLNVFSACKCLGGYEGFGCSDARNAISSQKYLASVLFLTLSNLGFLLPIIIALYRGWYIESLIYFYNMFFSTFYHACDQEFYSFCIFNYDGLQLADFISSYSSFVITILSMSMLSRPWKVFSFFAGLLACLSINLYDRFNYVAFIIFLVLSLGVTVLTWVRICYTERQLYPKKNQLLKFYLPGFSLAITGLVIYSFLQTKSNYWILHSLWHLCMATSIIFFLPKRGESSTTAVFRPVSTSDVNNPHHHCCKDTTATSSSLNDSTASSSINSSSPSTGGGGVGNNNSSGSNSNSSSAAELKKIVPIPSSSVSAVDPEPLLLSNNDEKD